MKNRVTKLMVLLCAALSVTACKEDNRGYPEIGENGEVKTKGYVSFANLSVDVVVPSNLQASPAKAQTQAQTKAPAVSTDDYIVTLTNAKTGAMVNEWKKSELPQKVEIYSGNYTLSATNLKSPKSAVFDQPHYLGSSETFTVSENATTTVDPVVCKQHNMSVQVIYGEAFRQEMASYSVMVSSARGSLPLAPDEQRLAYFDVVPLTVVMTGVRNDGENIVRKTTLSEVASGDHHVVNFDMTSTGNAVFDIRVDVTTNEKRVDVVVTDDNTVVDPDPEEPGPEEPGPEEPDNDPSIAGVGFDITKTMFLTEGEEKSVDVNVLAPDGGIQALKVYIESPTLEPLLDMVGLSTSLNLANPSTVSQGDKPSEKEALKTLNLITDEPIVGKTDFTFSIGSFIPLLPVGNHKFKVEMQDGGGKTINTTLSISVSSK